MRGRVYEGKDWASGRSQSDCKRVVQGAVRYYEASVSGEVLAPAGSDNDMI